MSLLKIFLHPTGLPSLSRRLRRRRQADVEWRVRCLSHGEGTAGISSNEGIWLLLAVLLSLIVSVALYFFTV